MIQEIKLALYGQFDNDTKLSFTYPDTLDNSFGNNNITEKDLWIRYLIDPREARNFNAEKVYALWRNGQGNYYAIIVPNKKDSRSGYIMLAMFLGNRKSSNGGLIIQTLDRLKEMIIDNEERNKEIIAQCLRPLEVALLPQLAPPAESRGRAKGFRTYSTTGQLDEIMQHIEQEEYSNYASVLVVPSDAVSPKAQNAGYQEIRSVIRHQYKVIVENPTNTKVSASTVADGDCLTIVFSKGGGYDDYRQEVDIKPRGGSVYYQIRDGYVRIPDPKDLNISFVKSVKFKVTSKGGLPIETVYINNEIHSGNSPFKYILNNDNRHFVFKADGYKKCEIDIDERDIFMQRTISVEMKPEEENLRRVINICGEKEEVCLSLKRDDTLYKYFKYPSNYSIEIKEKKESYGGNHDDGDNDDNKTGCGVWMKNLLFILFGLAIIGALCFGLYNECSGDKESKEIPSQEQTSSTQEQTQNNGSEPTEDENVQDNEITEEDSSEKNEKEDIIYLKKKGQTEDIWKRAEIKSSKYKTLIDYMKEGNIDELINHPYKDAEQVNEHWTHIVDYMKQIKNKGGNWETKMIEIIKESAKNDECDLLKLRNNLKRLLDKANGTNQHDKINESDSDSQGGDPENGGRPKS